MTDIDVMTLKWAWLGQREGRCWNVLDADNAPVHTHAVMSTVQRACAVKLKPAGLSKQTTSHKLLFYLQSLDIKSLLACLSYTLVPVAKTYNIFNK